MEELFQTTAQTVALILQAIAILMIFVGAMEAVYRTFWPWLQRQSTENMRRDAWLVFARWLLLGLEFTLAADIVHTAIAPTWNDIGQLAAIAVIRTFLNFFLERDIENARREDSATKSF